MRLCTMSTVAVMTLILPVSNALAQERPADSATQSKTASIAVTPYVALGSPGASSVGTFVSFPLNAKFSFETELGYRRAEGNIHALSSSANIVFDLPSVRAVVPYVTAGAGLYQYGSPLVLANGSIGTRFGTTVALNAGGGVKVPVNENLGMRTDVRWFKPLSRDASESWRVAHGVSFGRSR